MFTLHFSVSVPFPIFDDQFVFVTGSHESLGSWDTRRALRLEKDDENHWTGITNLSVDTVKFRYFIGNYLQSDATKDPVLVISKWEAHFTPRCVMPPVEASKSGVCRANLRDVFGYNSGSEQISDSFVLGDDVHHIALTVSGAALKFYKKKHEQQNYRVKIVPFDLRNKFDMTNLDDDEELNAEDETPLPSLPSHSCTEIAALTQACPKFKAQQEFGELFQNSIDYHTFRTYSVAVEFLSFRIEVYSNQNNDLIAQGYALPSSLHDTYGKTSVPLLTKRGVPTGKIYFSYLFIRPIRLPHPRPIMHNCYAKYWKKRVTLEVGHRGMGESYTKFAVARENTLHSLNSAAKRGADFVEFDVHLTKDLIPIVYHDFHVMVSVAKKRTNTESSNSSSIDSDGRIKSNNGSVSPPNSTTTTNSPSVDFYQLAVKDLNLNQLRLLHLDHVKHKESNNVDQAVNGTSTQKYSSHHVTGEHDEAEEHRPFPTLLEALKNVSHDVGFNIEIKYPQLIVSGENEVEGGYIERNEFLDIILSEILNNADNNRHIVFSSFDADMCKMISEKQKKYPVLFLCLGKQTRYPDYEDERTRSSLTAVKFTYSCGLMGVNFHSEDLLLDPTPVSKAKELGLISFVWEMNWLRGNIWTILSTNIGEGESRKNVFTLEKAMRAQLFSSKKSSFGKKSSSPPRCFSHNQLNSQAISSFGPGNRTRGMSASVWSNEFVDQNFGRSSIDGSPAMFSIGETDIEQQQQIQQQDPQQHFPIIRRHNSSQAQGTFGFLPVLPEALLKTQTNGGNINNNSSISSNNSSTTISSESNETFNNNNDIEMVTMNNKRFVASEI
uniref:Uncharacterized protein n=1 Tax=Meloidogyne enterolobii TaxID=390850 RepID=A0A6V7WLY6_MELEN|nr:unnamed protein product [Meloidogyne enterolobii]